MYNCLQIRSGVNEGRSMDGTDEGSPIAALYHMKAREMRRQADLLHDHGARQQVLMLALAYELLADHVPASGSKE
jgi:hypothetical protein